MDADGFAEDVLKVLAGQGTIVDAVFRVFPSVHNRGTNKLVLLRCFSFYLQSYFFKRMR